MKADPLASVNDIFDFLGVSRLTALPETRVFNASRNAGQFSDADLRLSPQTYRACLARLSEQRDKLAEAFAIDLDWDLSEARWASTR